MDVDVNQRRIDLDVQHGAVGQEANVRGRFPRRRPVRQGEAEGRGALPVIADEEPELDLVAMAIILAGVVLITYATTESAIRAALPEAEIVVVPAAAVSLADAIKSYLFNAQLLTLPSGEMGLVIPLEAWEHPRVRGWLDAMLAGNGPIRRVLPVDVRQSMANGGGPACLRLRVVADPATVDPRFLLDEAKAARIEAVIAAHWPEAIAPADLGSPALKAQVIAARLALLDVLELTELA